MFRSARVSHWLPLLATFLLFATPLALATDARFVVDPGIFDVRPPTEAPTSAGIALAYEGGALHVQVIAAGHGTLPDVNLGFWGETPRTRAFDRVDLNASVQRSSKLRSVPGGVVLEHRNTSLAAVRSAYTAALADLGFTLEAASTPNRWHFVNGIDQVRVNAQPEGKNVITYVGR